MKTILVEVKQKHIKAGEKDSCGSCPIALALIDAGWRKAWVGVTICAKTLYGENIALPEEVQHFIANFDQGWPVEPFTFELRYEA